jgi:hypothetical protein
LNLKEAKEVFAVLPFSEKQFSFFDIAGKFSFTSGTY